MIDLWLNSKVSSKFGYRDITNLSSKLENLRTIVNDTDSNNALGTSAGVCGHGAAGCAGGDAPSARSQTSPFHIGMGEAADAAGHGGAAAGDGGAGDARALRRGRRAPGPAAQHTAARRRVRPGRAPAAASTLSARRADEKQRPASTKQVRERCARVGGRGGHGAAAGRGRPRGGRGGGGCRQEGRAAAEGHALDGAHERAATAGVRAAEPAAPLRHGPPARASRPAPARRVTPPRRTTPPPYHAYIPLSGRSDSPECTRVPEYYRLAIYLLGTVRPRGAPPVICAMGRVVTVLRVDAEPPHGLRTEAARALLVLIL